MNIIPTIGERFRLFFGAFETEPEPSPDLEALAYRWARKIIAEVVVDLDHPSAEDMIAWRIKRAILEDRRGKP